MAHQVVVDLPEICTNFPKLPKPLIDRETTLNTLDEIFAGGTQVIVIEGREGIGKTTLLAQFALRFPNRAISLFISPTRLGYDPQILQFNLCNQIQWLLHKKELPSPKDIPPNLLQMQISPLLRIAKKQPVFFIIDGLSEIPDHDHQTRETIMSMLPLGFADFRFLFSGQYSHIVGLVPPNTRLKPQMLSAFDLDDTVKYFADLNLEHKAREDVYQTFKGVPGNLAAVRRTVISGIGIDVILNDPSQTPDLFGIEWRTVDDANNSQMLALAILAFDFSDHTMSSLARLLDISESEALQLLENVSLLAIDKESGSVRYVSETYRKFAADRLRNRERDVYQLIITQIHQSSVPEDTLQLPYYLFKAGQIQELLNILSTEHFIRALTQARSLKPLQRKAELGIQAAQTLKRDQELARLSISKSVMNSFEKVQIWRSEVQARVAVGDYASALALAQQATLKEDHLHALAVVARYQQEHAVPIDNTLLEQIELLCNQIDTTDLGEKALDIASDLLPINHRLALALIERATGAGTSENSLDWALARLSVDALESDNKIAIGSGVVDSIRSRIEDPQARQFTQTLAIVVGDYSSAEVLRAVEELPTVSDQVFVLRSWAMKNREAQDAVDVVEYALKLIIRATDYAPNARVLREIAAPLSYAHDLTSLKKLVASFDGQKNAVGHLGPTQDLVRLQLILAQAEMRYDQAAARNRLVETYFYVLSLDDLTLRTECLVRLDVALDELDVEGVLEAQEGIHETVTADMQQGITFLLETVGDHYYATRGIIRALSKRRPHMAFQLAQNLNLELRRDLATRDFIFSQTDQPLMHIEWSLLHEAIAAIVDSNLRDTTLLHVLARLNTEESEFAQFQETLPLINMIEYMRNARQRCNAYCLAYNIIGRNEQNQYTSLMEGLLSRLRRAWETIDSDWDKIETSHRITETLAESNPASAQQYLESSESLSRTAILDSPPTARAYIQCTQLLIRAYAGLLRRRIDSDNDLKRLTYIVDFVPSKAEKALLWSEVALRMYSQKRVDDCKRIVLEHVTPIADLFISEGLPDTDDLVIMVAPALYVAHQFSAFAIIDKVPIPVQDQAYGSICAFLLSRKVPSDPNFSTLDCIFDLSYESILDICEVLTRVHDDSVIGLYTEIIADTMTARDRDRQFSVQQRIEIANRISQLSHSLPLGDRGIKHAGFKIMVQANKARLHCDSDREWHDLIEAARNIPNISDRAFVTATLASYRPSNRRIDIKTQAMLYNEALELAKQIPCLYDRIDRYEYIAITANDPDLQRRCLRLAMESAAGCNEPEFHTEKRNLVDLAYQRIGAEFAASLASLADDDPARLATPPLQDRLAFLDLKKRIANEDVSEPDKLDLHTDRYPSIAWALLRDLNAGKLAPLHLDTLRGYFKVIAQLPLEQSYPIAAFMIENSVRRFADTDQANTILRPLFESMLLTAQLTQNLVIPSIDRLKQVQRYADRSSDPASAIFSFGDRAKAMQWIEDWIAQEVTDFLVICDQYFGPRDLHFLQLLRAMQSPCTVSVLTSLKQQHQDDALTEPWNDYYRTYWRTKVSPIQDPPETDIIVVGTSSGKAPIHDRWWLTNGAGISIGTSLDSLGRDQISEISKMSKTQAVEKLDIVEPYLRRTVKVYRGEPLTYKRITLP